MLDSLTECLVPSTLHAQCVSAMNRDEAFEVWFPCLSVPILLTVILKALDSFPPVTVNVSRPYLRELFITCWILLQVWISVTAFLHFIVQQSSNSEGTAERIGQCSAWSSLVHSLWHTCLKLLYSHQSSLDYSAMTHRRQHLHRQ
jgi:inositol polyphosphate 5-phosphatase INPP5B/F